MSKNPGELRSPAAEGRIQLPAGELTVSSEPEQHFAIRHTDWRQLQKKLARIKNPAPSLAAVAWTCVGIAAASVVAYLPWTAAYAELPAKAQLHYSYISPLLVILAIATAALAIILFIVNYNVKRVNVVSIDNVLEDMDDIYAPYAATTPVAGARPANVSPKVTYRQWLKSMPLWHK